MPKILKIPQIWHIKEQLEKLETTDSTCDVALDFLIFEHKELVAFIGETL